ncbi:hypothetical protein CYLTODRAFT_419705 [Cylindrobasidium torrendii FP15055 ss-10]|uniref:Uncharacterized protein n=1 Tax=Cylindrobasidium torrendii FP15055 ss-10 TaxID=1314674 RepID=A0A0D7BJQ1_9AGAR|nr:hypothetical protein CYLTODRAFT_419705 [Cylindrobasidium torrendii FP15055 ss-10]
MAAIYTEDCISLSPYFTEPQPVNIQSTGVEYMLGFANSTGIDRATLAKLLESPSNTVLIQPNLIFAFKRRKVSFVPIDSIVSSMAGLYDHNYASTDEERRRMGDVPELKSPLFRFNIAKFNYPGLPHLSRFMPVYTKHPLTGHVTKHVAPYSDLPTFQAKTAHASLLVLAALSFRVACNLVDTDCGPWTTLATRQRPTNRGRNISSIDSSRICKPNASSRKRKATTDGEKAARVSSPMVAPCLVLKRRRVEPMAPLTCAVQAEKFHPMQTRLAAARSGYQC